MDSRLSQWPFEVGRQEVLVEASSGCTAVMDGFSTNLGAGEGAEGGDGACSVVDDGGGGVDESAEATRGC